MKLFSGDQGMLDRDVNSYCINNKIMRRHQDKNKQVLGMKRGHFSKM